MSIKQVGESLKDNAKVFMILAYLKVEGKIVISELPIAYDFPKVFLDDINDLLLEYEVEFSIDLVPGTSHASMVPYRMLS